LSSIKTRPILNEKTPTTHFDSHYIYHPAWAVRILKQLEPEKHIDISSTLFFCTQISAFIPTEFYDYRPAQLRLTNLHTGKADLTKLPFESNSIYSLSCMHTIEHVGLGRYGDPINPSGDILAMRELARVVKQGGHLLIVTPIGKPMIQFNAHRIYSFKMIIDEFHMFSLKNFSLITDEGIFIENADPILTNHQQYGCGCFHFYKQ
jgi:SAM-dependent methyltransferase